MVTHDDLIKLGAKWLRAQHSNGRLVSPDNQYWHTGCGVVLTEFVSSESSIPDVIGFNSHDTSIVIECKTSHADFLNDLKKPHRNSLRLNQCGNYRYYLCPPDIIKESELTNGWGLMYVIKDKIKVIKAATKHCEPEVKVAEWWILYSIARRAEIKGLMAELRKPIPFKHCDKCDKPSAARYHYNNKLLCAKCYKEVNKHG